MKRVLFDKFIICHYSNNKNGLSKNAENAFIMLLEQILAFLNIFCEIFPQLVIFMICNSHDELLIFDVPINLSVYMYDKLNDELNDQLGQEKKYVGLPLKVKKLGRSVDYLLFFNFFFKSSS